MKSISYNEYIEYYKENNKFYCGSFINLNKTYTISQLKQKYNKYIQKLEKQKRYQEQKYLEKKEKYEKQKEEFIQKVINNELELEFEVEKDEQWEKVSDKVWIRDNFKCRLIKVLSEQERKLFFSLVSEDIRKHLEVAHFIARSQSKKLYYAENNLYLVNYFSHRMLDEFKHPLTGKFINKNEVDYWWKRIINNDNLYNWLKEIK